MADQLARLTEIGFTIAGSWKLDGDSISCQLKECSTARNVLYAFTVNGQLMYVGKTIRSLRSRMAGYRSPGPTQSTNIKNKRKIREALTQGSQVDVYVLPDNGLLHYGGFHVNLAAGLEDSVVRELNPPWNGGQKESVNQTLEPTHPT